MNVILSKETMIRKARETLANHFRGIKLHDDAMMVGGTIRDILLGRTPKDIDIATPKTAELVQGFVDKGFTHVLLDEQRDIHRMVGNGVHIDITPLHHDHIHDLIGRDFTINAIGLVISTEEVLDPQGGMKDLSKGLVRALSEDRFLEDPLRLIRAFRIAADLSFSIDPVTKRFITKHAHLINRPSKERIRDEVCWTIEAPRSYPVIEELTRTGILGRILPEFASVSQVIAHKPHALGLTEHLLWTYKYLEDILEDLDSMLGDYADNAKELLSTVMASDRKMFICTKLAGLLHDIGKPQTITYEEEVHFLEHDRVGSEMVSKRMEELKFSSAETKTVSGIVLNHMRPHNLQRLDSVSPKAVFKYFRDLEQIAIPTLLVAVADAYATQMVPYGSLEAYHEFVKSMVAENQQMGKPKPLLTGDEIMKLLGIGPGPEIGLAVSYLVEAQALGQITTKTQAKELIKSKGYLNEGNA
ncbi:MAG: HD domain-containing protein [Caldisericales bacterium]|nr:HD domain-containing protein [Caldisericales bacterium]